jgi:hypothetical protein
MNGKQMSEFVIEQIGFYPPEDPRYPTWAVPPKDDRLFLFGFVITRLPNGRARYIAQWAAKAFVDDQPDKALEILRQSALQDAQLHQRDEQT